VVANDVNAFSALISSQPAGNSTRRHASLKVDPHSRYNSDAARIDAVQGLCNGRVSVRPSVPSTDCRSLGAGSRYRTIAGAPRTGYRSIAAAELSMGPFCVTRSNPTHQLTDPTQPYSLQVEKFGPNLTQPNTTTHKLQLTVIG